MKQKGYLYCSTQICLFAKSKKKQKYFLYQDSIFTINLNGLLIQDRHSQKLFVFYSLKNMNLSLVLNIINQVVSYDFIIFLRCAI